MARTKAIFLQFFQVSETNAMKLDARRNIREMPINVTCVKHVIEYFAICDTYIEKGEDNVLRGDNSKETISFNLLRKLNFLVILLCVNAYCF